ncbi:hypothetical protein COS81_03760 [candidate division WWE3 bacterium CG06_land_8_20_14_3_00_42_16]|uniref:Uncharacterized protein n=1 Tax=candidate division WWE3 bacterium CG06_land_8_20_14_3_00_42_16 TaxID=1975083 RepID=A0A2M7AM91_UNCKA|nr:MAG: hypothetical protein COS81_03760 [candidate division WWE3 bacterium CG06_land_8_20_14_3_00_42_16]
MNAPIPSARQHFAFVVLSFRSAPACSSRQGIGGEKTRRKVIKRTGSPPVGGRAHVPAPACRRGRDSAGPQDDIKLRHYEMASVSLQTTSHFVKNYNLSTCSICGF